MNYFKTSYVVEKIGLTRHILFELERKKLIKVERTEKGTRKYSQENIDFIIDNKEELLLKLHNRPKIKIPNSAKKIKGALDWVDIDGKIYGIDKRKGLNVVYVKAQRNMGGYMYCPITYLNEKGNKIVKSKRVNRLVALTHIKNPDNLPIVGHRNNIKTDNRIDNLYWTTTKENTQKAVDDGLMVNDKGFDDSQSKPVNMYDTYTNNLIGIFGSISEASKYKNISKSTISRQCKYKRPVRKDFYFRYCDDESINPNEYLVAQYDYDTDNLVEVFVNVGQASAKTNYLEKTISSHIKRDKKPKVKYLEHYFKKYTHTDIK